jgi:hypothetical protein
MTLASTKYRPMMDHGLGSNDSSTLQLGIAHFRHGCEDIDNNAFRMGE